MVDEEENNNNNNENELEPKSERNAREMIKTKRRKELDKCLLA